MQGRNLYKIAIEGVGLLICCFTLLACLTFDIADAPSGYVSPNNNPPQNLCGPVGAFLAYYILYYVGPGFYVVCASIVGFLITNILGRKVTQLILRLIGMAILTVSVSSSVYLIVGKTGNGFPMGEGGILGISVGHILLKGCSAVGSGLILVCSFAVGSVLLADSLVLAMVRMLGRIFIKLFGGVSPAVIAARDRSNNLTKIWSSLSNRQKKQRKKHKSLLLNSQNDDSLEELVSSDDEEYIEPIEVIPPSEEAQAKQKKRKKKFKITRRKQSKPKPYIQRTYEDYTLPPLSLLEDPEETFAEIQEDMVKDCAAQLEELLHDFNIEATVVNAEPGPAITMYELELSSGIKVSQISNLNNDIARALAAPNVRIVAPIPGKRTVGIEVPNKHREIVRTKDLVMRAGDKPNKMKIPLFLGKDSSGEALVSDLASMPHALIAGTTGSGKSVCLNTIITSILLTRRPDEVKLILIDPKMVEMVPFNNIPHLLCPIVTEMRKAEQILEWAVTKMDERYAILAEAGVRNISSYNALSREELIERFNPQSPEEEAKIPKVMPHVVIIVDELADLMMMSAKEVESYIVRIAQKSRAVGIHIILATQRPQATVVTGLIKSNLPCRISFRVASRMDSRIILDYNGAETLLGQGDMLFLKPGTSELIRVQGSYLDDGEIRRIVTYLKDIAEPQYHPELMQMNKVSTSGMKKDELFDQAVRIVLESKRGSVSLLQRKLSIGYARSSRIIEMMAESGILGEYKGAQAREVLMTLEEWENISRQVEQDAQDGYRDLDDDFDNYEEQQ